MAISYGTVTTDMKEGGQTSPVTFSYNNAVDSNRNTVLIVAVLLEDNSGDGTVTGVTYNGESMAEITSVAQAGNPVSDLAVFLLETPPTGSNTVSIAFSEAVTSVLSAAFTVTNIDGVGTLSINTADGASQDGANLSEASIGPTTGNYHTIGILGSNTNDPSAGGTELGETNDTAGDVYLNLQYVSDSESVSWTHADPAFNNATIAFKVFEQSNSPKSVIIV